MALTPGPLHRFLCSLPHAWALTASLQPRGQGASRWGLRQWAAGKPSHAAQMVLETAPVTLGGSEDQGCDNVCPWRVCWEEQRAQSTTGCVGLLLIGVTPFLLILLTVNPAPNCPRFPTFPCGVHQPFLGELQEAPRTRRCCKDPPAVGILVTQDA